MLFNFVKVAYRSLLRNKSVSFINLSGLSVGIACSLLILLYVIDEINYDDFYTDNQSLYRLQLHRTFPDRESWFATAPIPIGPAVSANIPEVEATTRLFRVFNETQVSRNRIDDFFETRVLAAEENFFDLFSFPFLEGSREEALMTPNSVVLTASMAEKYFGRTDVVGESLEIQDSLNYQVTAVIADVPKRSHFEFDLLLSLNSFPQIQNNNFWGSYNCYNYLKLRDGATPDLVADKIPSLVEQYMAPQVEAIVGTRYEDYVAAGNNHNYFLLPVRDIHLNSNYQNEIKPNGSISNAYFFSTVAILILMIACFNFMNLSTAASVKRSREVGLRKVLGSDRKWLIFQFITESVVLTAVATILAIGIIFYALPFFNSLAGKQIAFSDLNWIRAIPVLFIFVLLVGGFAGSYPAFFISGFSTIKILKGGLKIRREKFSLRNMLVVAQFGVSIFLVLITLLIYRQTDHMINQRLGFDKERIMVLDRTSTLTNVEQFMGALKVNSAIEEVAASNNIPGRNTGGGTFEAIGMPAAERYLFDAMVVDYQFADAYGLKLIRGRFFDPDLRSDTAAIVINEATWRMVGWDDPIGKEVLPTSGTRRKIIGVVEDFHYASLHEEISPLVFFGISRQALQAAAPPQLSIRIARGQQVSEVVSFVESEWDEWNPSNKISYSFLDADFDALYEQEMNFAAIFSTFTGLAIFIALVGVLGLSAFISAQRIKEIGVRKVLGASVQQILWLLSLDFVRLVAAANLLVIPLAYLVMKEWLSNYPYSIGVPVDVVIITAVSSMICIVLIVSFHAYRAAVKNPAQTLKYE